MRAKSKDKVGSLAQVIEENNQKQQKLMIEQKQELESKVGKYKEENESLKETTNKLKQEV